MAELSSLWRAILARPRTLAAAGAGLAAIGFAGGWISASQVKPEVEYTSAKLGEAPERAVPPAPDLLQAELDRLAKAHGEAVGIAVTDVAEGWTASVDGGELFPQQSVSKLWVALAVLQAVDEGRLTLDRQVIMGPDDRSVFYQPLAERIRGDQGFPITLAELLRHALVESDNSANDKLIRELGGPDAVTEVINDKGLEGVAIGAYERDLQARTAGLEWKPEYGVRGGFKTARAKLPPETRTTALAAYLANPPDGATPEGIVTALAALKRGELLSRASTDFMIELMGEARTGPRRLKGGLPTGWMIAHKTGTGPDWKTGSVGINDVGLITAPDGRAYAVAVLMRQTMHNVPARLAFMQSVTRAVAAHWSETQGLPAEGGRLALR